MAAGRERFSREVVIEDVFVESVETEEDEGPDVSLNDILEASISNFTALRGLFYFAKRNETKRNKTKYMGKGEKMLINLNTA